MEPDQRRQLHDVLSRSAADLTSDLTSGSRSYEQRLEGLTRAALTNVPGVDWVGLTMRARGGALQSFAPTSADVAELDRLQSDLGEGPCRDVVVDPDGAALVQVRDFSTESRWPRFSAAAVERGALSLISYAMAPQGATPGAVNFYSRSRDGFDAMAIVIAGAFAMQAGVAVYGARRISDLENALQSRDVIGQAKGVLMERHGIGDTEAFGRLVRGSQTTNLKLVDIARWLIAEGRIAD